MKGESLVWLTEAVTRATDDCVLWPFYTDSGGYGRLGSKVGGSRKANVAALVLAGSSRPCYPRNKALHSCHTPACVNPRHLRWGTQAENVSDRQDADRQARGIRSGGARLCPAEVIAIRSDHRSNRQIAAIYGVHHSTIGALRKGLTWRSVSV